jgi:hypothetical protein
MHPEKRRESNLYKIKKLWGYVKLRESNLSMPQLDQSSAVALRQEN